MATRNRKKKPAPKDAPAQQPDAYADHAQGVAIQLMLASREIDERANSIREASFALSYLDAFGYLKRELAGWVDISLEDVKNAIVGFQEFFGLQQTGNLDARTVRAMEAPRCGHPDHAYAGTAVGLQEMRIREFAATNLPRWRKTSLTYCITDYVAGLGKQEQEAIIQKAWDQWSAVAALSVRKANPGEACDILIGTGQGARSNFDGPGGTLAWAYLPQGDDRQLVCKFDLDETWVGLSGTGRGIVMLNVATHEFGHLLGLDHSRVQTALMAPYYSPSIGCPQDNDDIPRIQARYSPPVAAPAPAPTPAPTPAPRRRTIEVVGDATILIDGRAA